MRNILLCLIVLISSTAKAESILPEDVLIKGLSLWDKEEVFLSVLGWPNSIEKFYLPAQGQSGEHYSSILKYIGLNVHFHYKNAILIQLMEPKYLLANGRRVGDYTNHESGEKWWRIGESDCLYSEFSEENIITKIELSCPI